jgi:hypothetical protein
MTLKSTLLLTVIFFCYKIIFAQTPVPYEKSWKKIDSLIHRRGLPQSALEEVNKLYASAKKERQEGQWIKAVIYRQQLSLNAEQDLPMAALERIEEEIRSAPPRVAAVLKSLEAEQLYDYLKQQRYRLSARTETPQDSSADISTWSAGRLHKKIRQVYLGSLADERLLQETNLAPYDAVILKGNVHDLRPTLYDLLAHRALDYFQEDDPEQPLSEDAFLMDNPVVFSDAESFSHYSFSGSDTNSNHLVALRIFQNLLRFHAGDAKPDAEADADISRISFVNRYAVMPGKDSLYLSALRSITDLYSSLPAAAQAWYLQAAYFSQRAASFDPVADTTDQYAYIKAKAICERVLTQKDSSEGKSNCLSLLNNIVRKSFTLQTEKVNLPDLPFRVLISYKNVDHVYARLIRIDDATRDALGNSGWDVKFWKRLVHFPVLKSFDQALPKMQDYQEHRVEIKVDALPAGQYALFTSSAPEFGEDAVLNVQYFFCSAIAFIHHGQDYFVADRNSGAPLSGVTVQALGPVYDGKQQKYIFRKKGSYQTDQHGYFRLAADKNDRYENTRLEFYHAKDFLSSSVERVFSLNNGDEYPHVDAEGYEQKMKKDILFTDRAIYRPGQTVYFKGLLVTRGFGTRRYKIVSGAKAVLYLLDAQYQPVDSVNVLSDAFGSFHGSFHLPGQLLNGTFSIRDSATQDAKTFSVEAYKRPRFSVAYDPVTGSYRLGDSVHLRGSAKGYAGNVISGSPVRYRVLRESRFPYPWLFRRMPANAEQEIAYGTALTDDHGQFKIDFSALPDPSIARTSKPVFTYRVETDVTDLNGETRSASTAVSASYQSFQIITTLPQESRMNWDSLGKMEVTTRNSSGEFLRELLTIRLYRLSPPDRLIRKRYWEQPDQFVMTENVYRNIFPNDEYRNETDKTTWEKTKVGEATDSTRPHGLLAQRQGVDAKHSGWYLVEFGARDSDGEWITDKRYVELANGNEKKSGYLVYNSAETDDQTAEPGNDLTIQTGTSVSDAYVIRAREGLDDSAAQYSFYKLSNEIRTTVLSVGETDRGGFAVNDVFIKNNRWYGSRHVIHVPWSNHELQISYGTWRDKLLPGDAERWKVKISGAQKNKVTAEVLTAMYDASLDQFQKQSWSRPDLFPVYSTRDSWDGLSNFNDESSVAGRNAPETLNDDFFKQYDRLTSPGSGNIMFKANQVMLLNAAPGAPARFAVRGFAPSKVSQREDKKTETEELAEPKIIKDETAAAGQPAPINPSGIQTRKNFDETAFFFPDLKTDAEGNVEISFTMPEALTQWKWMIFAHTKDLATGYSEKSVVTQKELMLQPNIPRFLREGDSLRLAVKISNLSSGQMTGLVQLDWLDASDNSNENLAFRNTKAVNLFSVEAGQNAVVYFSTVVPADFQQPVRYRLVAKTNAGTANDGEEGLIPVLSNRMLVTEALPLNMAGKNSRHFSWEKLLNSKKSETLQHQSLTVEYSTNPAWYAVQSLPYLMQFPYECAEQTFNRFYANALATQIVHGAPGIQAIFEKWKNLDSSALLSNLEKNEELKSALLRETPWVLNAQQESQQKRNLALLFDLARMSRELKSTGDKLKQMQSEGGGFPWFRGGRDDRYITQYIISGIGHLRKLKAVPANEQLMLDQLVRNGIGYLDKQLKSEYDRRPKKQVEDISAVQIQYLYMRSFFPEVAVSGSVFPALNYYRQQAIRYWPKQNMYLRGMIALFLQRTGDRKTAKDIIASLKENATRSEDIGMFWKTATPGYYWSESPVETQSLLLEAFDEISPELKLDDEMKYWLLQQKHTQSWSNTKSTADACYALLLTGNNWLAPVQTARIQLGNYQVSSSDEKAEAGTGYMKKIIPGKDILPAMGDIQVTVEAGPEGRTAPSWGALYWQYFENLDKISPAQSPLSVSKLLYVERNTGSGPQLQSVSEGNSLEPGDKLMIRMIIKSDRDMEYVHLKDMRAAGLEPVSVLSGYHWQGDLGYYESTLDESTDFFFDHLPRGTHTVEYPLWVTTEGGYSNGISTLECMYAPEFAAHTEGLRIRVIGK